MERILFKGGTVATASGSYVADLLVVDGVIESIGRALDVEDAEIVDCGGKILVPGGVDVHTHLDAPMMGTATADDFESGTRAAAAGGTTAIVDFAMQAKGQRLQDTLDTWHEKARGKTVIDYGFHAAVTDLYDGAIDDLRGIVDDGVTSIKIYMAYKGAIMLHDGEIYQVLKATGRYGAQTCVHAENGDVIDQIAADLVAEGKTAPRFHEIARPPLSEIEAVRRAIDISKLADSPIYFVHLSTDGATEAVAEARHHGWPVAGETCTHYLTLGPEMYDKPGFEAAKAVLTPPLREKKHQDALWRGLNSGALGVVSSDHCPFCLQGQKELGKHDFRAIPNGGAGIEHRMILMYSEGVAKGRISLERFVDLTATTPAKSFGMYPRKGHLGVGADADIVVINPHLTTHITVANQNMAMDYSLWEGWDLTGRLEQVYSRGELVAENGKVVGRSGRGQFLHRATVS